LGVYPTLTIFHLYTSLSNSRHINQSARSSPQPISVGLFQHRHLHL